MLLQLNDTVVGGNHAGQFGGGVAMGRGLVSVQPVAAAKHWRGHGWATGTHSGAARVPSLAVLRREDMVPFEQGLDVHVPLLRGKVLLAL